MATSVSLPARSTSVGPVNLSTGSVSTEIKPSQSSRTIASLVFLASGIALVGNELHGGVTGSLVSTQQHASATRIVLGGTFSGVTLVLLSHAGDAGQQFATGLAVVLFLSSALVYGAPFWKLISSLTSAKPSTPSTPTKPVTTTAKG